jgi:hypothetical protein
VWGEGAAGTPPDNHVFIYAKDKSGTSGLFWKNDAGTEFDLSISNPVTGTGVSGRVAFWNSTSSITSDADLTFSVDTLTATKIIAPTSITISTLTAGSVVFAGTAGILSQNNANFFWDDTNKRLGIGVTPAFPLHLQTADASSFNLTIDAYGTGVSANYRGRVARGTTASPSQLTTDDNCTLLSALPYNNSPGFAGGARAQIQMNAAEAQTSSAQGMYINFKTTPTGSTTIAERFRIGPAGQWGIGGATYGTAGQYFRSGGASAAPTWATISDADLGSIFFLLAGRSGGQTAIGGTAAADGLILRATAGVGTGTENVKIQVGSNGASTIATFSKTSGSTATLELNSATASQQFNLAFSDNGTTKWIIYKTTGNNFGIWDAVNNTDILVFSPSNAVAAAGGLVKCATSISNSNATVVGLLWAPTFTGAGAGPWGASVSATFTPSASVGACYNSLNQGIFSPGSSVTITGGYAAYYSCTYGNTAGAVTTGYTLWCNAPSIAGSLKPTTQYGIYVQNQGAAGMTNGIGVHIDAMSGGTNSFDMSFGRVDTTAAGAYYGRVPVLYNGLLKYIHVFSA